ncbi:universal stress protein PHOS32-like [Actinidia eriantha]|uniref:universal stress protein PHOS32-like n=1 Tax=Actinidia eriantha TaxID=165200 RepID=UPI00258A0C1A|nr:universal stress protein PHOS32-like [Actinidia eriantha]
MSTSIFRCFFTGKPKPQNSIIRKLRSSYCRHNNQSLHQTSEALTVSVHIYIHLLLSIYMASLKKPPETERPPAAIVTQTASPRVPLGQSGTPTTRAQRRIAIAVDLSDESAYAVKWAVQNYLRRGDAVILLHVRPTSVLYGADWGAIDLTLADADDEASQQKLEDDFDAFTATKASDLAQPLVEAQIPFKIHIVKDHDMKERLCLEVERLGLSAVIMGSRGFGASKRSAKGRLGSVSDYCVHHCVCPVVVVRYPDEKDGVVDSDGSGDGVKNCEGLHPVAEDEAEYHDASDKQTDLEKTS